MTRTKNTKRSLISSVIALFLCFTMLLGTTFAWFTDSVTSAGNTIQAGSLKIDLSHKVDDDWISLKQNPDHKVFDYDKWEPGYTRVESLKIDNLGSLAFQYRLSIEVEYGTAKLGDNGENLADVIDVYVIDGESDATSFDTVKNTWAYKGTLSEVMKNPSTFLGGELLPTGEVLDANAAATTAVANKTVSIALHMQENAGNEYQKLSVGNIYVNLIAAQWSYEDDSFGNTYDEDAIFPEINIGGITVDVTTENNVVTEAATVSGTGVTATIPAGVAVQDGVKKLGLSVTEKTQSNANLTLNDGEALRSLDVHMDGVADNNTVPMLITIEKAMKVGLNIGNYTLYHVEDGVSNAMTAVNALSELDVHNEFYYDPATGDVTLAMATFSEVAMVAEQPNWEGNRDYSWYTNAVATIAEGEPDYVIANADQLAAFGAIVGGMDGKTQDSFSGKTVKLLADINLGDKESENNPDIIFYPIGYYNSEGTYERTNTAITSGLRNFEGTFDGNGNTISNFYHNTWEMKGDHDWYSPEEQYYRDGMGLFGRVYGGTVKNLTVRNFSSDGEIATTGVIAAYADGATFENIAIFDCNPRVYNIGNGGIVGCVGWYAKEANLETTFKNITVDNSNKISALWGSYDVACGGIVGQYYPTSGQSSSNYPVNGGVHFENCHVSSQMDVYNDVCGNYQYYAYRYAGMLIGSVRENETIDGHVYPKMDGITASGCTVHFGTWNDYYYCEIIDNTTASYTHDYQMSRLTEIKAIDGTTITYLDGTTGTVPASGRANYVIVDYSKGHGTDNATCYHFKDGEVWTHDMGGIQEGVDENGDGQDDLKEDKQHIYLEFNNLVTGYGWGVTSRSLTNLNGVTNLDIASGNQEASVEKFEDAGYAPKDYRAGETITIGDLFKVKGDAIINGTSVYVSVSPITEGDKVSASFILNTEDWAKSTITFAADSTGTAKVTITDYIFCTPTTIYLNEEDAVAKFGNKEINTQDAYTNITLGDIFGVEKGTNIIGNVTATVTDPNGNVVTVNGTSTNWAEKSFDLVKEGEWTVSIKDSDSYCASTEATFTVNKADKFQSKFTGDFLYRVGNGNAVAWTSLFADLSDTIAPSNLSIQVTKVAGNAAGTFDGSALTVSFTGTGVVTVTIAADGANPVELQLEVVDANNVTRYSELKEQNSVLLADITMSSGGTYRLTGNKVLYGNGFTFDVTNGAYEGVQYDYMSYVIYLENSRLDNVIIKGAVYPEIGGTKADSYNRAIVMTNGTCQITNSFISNGASPIRNGGNLELVNTTLKGGIYANLDLRNGHLILDNVTTINQIGSNETHTDSDGKTKEIVGMGIVVYQEGGTEELKITIRNNLTQYNYLSKTQADEHFTDTYRNAVKDVVFGSDFNAYQNNGWINFGIASMNSYLTAEDIVDERTDKAGYFGTSKTVAVLGNSRNCYVYSFKPTTTSVPTYPGYTTAGQGVIAPTVEFDFTDKNYVAKAEGSNDYCYADGNTVYISMDEGDSFVWDTSILTATKNGNALNYTVKIGGVDYTGKSFTFNTSGTHTVTYSYTDTYNYTLENGTIATFSKEYSESIVIEVSVVKATAKHAEFSFGEDGTAYSAKTVTIGDKTYVMPDVTATVSGKIGSTTVNGVTVYYPITEMYTSDGKTEHSGSWYACFPIFKDALQIIDYADQGTGASVTYSQTTVTTVEKIPSTLKATDPKTAFLYSMNATNYPPPTDPTAVSGAVCYTCNRNGLTSSNERSEENTVAEYTYTDNAGTVYYYYIGYHCAAQSSGSCFTGDTLITLADGTQKRIDQLTYTDELLVWDFYNGCYATTTASVIYNHGNGVHTVTNLHFNDGTTVKMINEHEFFDIAANSFVYISETNVADYVGHKFIKADGDGYEVVTLESYSYTQEDTGMYTILTAKYNNAIIEGILSLTPDPTNKCEDFFRLYEVGENMKYDEAKMQADIEKYGLFTYEDLSAYVTYEEFVAFNGEFYKILVGKGYITVEDIVSALATYAPNH